MMAQDINEIHHFVTEIENLLRLHNVEAAMTKCHEAKLYIQVLSGGVKDVV